jgi:DNA-binding NtrC family response regulator
MREQDVRAKVILMTAYDSPEVRSEAKRLRVSRYVKKPFDLPSMLDIVGEVIEGN